MVMHELVACLKGAVPGGHCFACSIFMVHFANTFVYTHTIFFKSMLCQEEEVGGTAAVSSEQEVSRAVSPAPLSFGAAMPRELPMDTTDDPIASLEDQSPAQEEAAPSPRSQEVACLQDSPIRVVRLFDSPERPLSSPWAPPETELGLHFSAGHGTVIMEPAHTASPSLHNETTEDAGASSRAVAREPLDAPGVEEALEPTADEEAAWTEHDAKEQYMADEEGAERVARVVAEEARTVVESAMWVEDSAATAQELHGDESPAQLDPPGAVEDQEALRAESVTNNDSPEALELTSLSDTPLEPARSEGPDPGLDHIAASPPEPIPEAAAKPPTPGISAAPLPTKPSFFKPRPAERLGLSGAPTRVVDRASKPQPRRQSEPIVARLLAPSGGQRRKSAEIITTSVLPREEVLVGGTEARVSAPPCPSPSPARAGGGDEVLTVEHAGAGSDALAAELAGAESEPLAVEHAATGIEATDVNAAVAAAPLESVTEADMETSREPLTDAPAAEQATSPSATLVPDRAAGAQSSLLETTERAAPWLHLAQWIRKSFQRPASTTLHVPLPKTLPWRRHRSRTRQKTHIWTRQWKGKSLWMEAWRRWTKKRVLETPKTSLAE